MTNFTNTGRNGATAILKTFLEMAWQWEQNGRVAELIHEGLDFKNRINVPGPVVKSEIFLEYGILKYE